MSEEPSYLWGYIFSGFGLLGMVLLGRRLATGWLILMGMQLIWITYAIWTEQPGFILMATVYGVVYMANWLTWRRHWHPRWPRRRRPPTTPL